jgi:hypothetical protein
LWWKEFWRIFEFWIGETRFGDGEGTGINAETRRNAEMRREASKKMVAKRGREQEAAERAERERIGHQSSVAGLGWRRMSPVLRTWSDEGGVLVGN